MELWSNGGGHIKVFIGSHISSWDILGKTQKVQKGYVVALDNRGVSLSYLGTPLLYIHVILQVDPH